MTEEFDQLEERVTRLEQAVNHLYKEQIKDRVKMIGSLEYIVERMGLAGLSWKDISEIHREIEDSFDEAYEKVKQDIREEEKIRKLIDSVFKKSNPPEADPPKTEEV